MKSQNVLLTITKNSQKTDKRHKNRRNLRFFAHFNTSKHPKIVQKPRKSAIFRKIMGAEQGGFYEIQPHG